MRILPLILLVLLGFSCAVPGSAITDMALEATVTWQGGEPVADTEIQVVLPSSYGMGGLDHFFGDPEDYGHRDQLFSDFTDDQGALSMELGSQVYHVAFFLVPPLLGLFNSPPAPWILLRFADHPDEYYAIHTIDGSFVVLDGLGEERPVEHSRIHSITGHHLVQDGGDWDRSIGVLSVVLKSDSCSGNCPAGHVAGRVPERCGPLEKEVGR